MSSLYPISCFGALNVDRNNTLVMFVKIFSCYYNDMPLDSSLKPKTCLKKVILIKHVKWYRKCSGFCFNTGIT